MKKIEMATATTAFQKGHQEEKMSEPHIPKPKLKTPMLWISDASKIGLDIKSVCLMGTIVNVVYAPYAISDEIDQEDNGNYQRQVLNKPAIYEIDDGTGVMRVVHFPQKTTKKWPLEIGTAIEVRGVPQIFRDNLEVKAFSVKVFEHPNDEVERMAIVNQFRQTSAFQTLFLAEHSMET